MIAKGWSKICLQIKNFREKINMSGVNSINWARIVFQIVYYFFIGLKFLNKPISFLFPQVISVAMSILDMLQKNGFTN